MTQSALQSLSFDITQYLNKMGGNRNHLRADARIAAFAEIYPTGTLINEIVESELITEVKRDERGNVISFTDNSYAIVKASIDTGMGRSANGHKLGAMADDGLEKLLTGSTARAIRHVGINTKEVVERLLNNNSQAKPNQLLEEIKKGESTYEYINVDSRLMLLMQDHAEFSIETEIIHLDLAREFAKFAFDKNIKKKRWYTAFGYVRFLARLQFKNGAIREGIGSANGLELDGFHWFAKGETNAIGRALATAGYSILDAKEFHEDEADISDSPIYYEGTDLPKETAQAKAERAQPEVAPVAEVQTAQAKAERAQPEVPVTAAVQEEGHALRLYSNEECMNELTAIKPQLSDLEFRLMVDMREQANPILREDHTTWSNEDWNYTLAIGKQFLAWKAEGKLTPKQRETLIAPYRNFHGAPILEKLAGKLIAKKRLEQLSDLEMQYLLFKLFHYDFFCRLACYIDYAEGISYPILLNEFGLESPLEFMYTKQVLASKYVGRLYELREKLDAKFYEYYLPEDIPGFFADYGYGIEDPQKTISQEEVA